MTERAVDFITILSEDFARHIINHHFFTSSSMRFGMTSSQFCVDLVFYVDSAFEIISGTDFMSSRHANQTS